MPEEPQNNEPFDPRPYGSGLEDLRHALKLGLGRAFLIVQAGYTPAFRDLITDACVHAPAPRGDYQNVGGHYLFEVVQQTGEPEYYLQGILEALQNSKWRGDPDRLSPGHEERSFIAECDEELQFDLAVRFARQGDKAAKQAAYDVFYRNAEGGSSYGIDEIISLDGIEGIIAAAEHLPDMIEVEGSGILWWIWRLEERDGPEAAWDAIDQAAADRPQLRRAADSIRAKCVTSPQGLHGSEDENDDESEEPEPDLSYEQLLDVFRNQPGDREKMVQQWAGHATQPELEQAARDLLAQDDEHVQPFLHIFYERSFPFDPARLIQLAHTLSSDLPECAANELALSALQALCPLRHPDVRALGLELVQHPPRCGEPLGLLVNNFETGDERLVEDLFARSRDGGGIPHDIGFPLWNLVRANPGGEWTRSFHILYEFGLCSYCRYDAVVCLAERGAVPEWMVIECLHDDYVCTREWAAGVVAARTTDT